MGEEAIVVHDAHRADPSYATALARLAEAPIGPTPIGVLRDVKRPVYGAGRQQELAPAHAGASLGDVDELLRSGDTWTVVLAAGRVSKLRLQISISLDGYVAGPNQSEEDPLGEGGEAAPRVGRRAGGLAQAARPGGGEVNASTPVMEEALANVGATIMGRNMFGGGPGPWREDPPGTAGGARTRLSTCRSSSSPTTSASRSS